METNFDKPLEQTIANMVPQQVTLTLATGYSIDSSSVNALYYCNGHVYGTLRFAAPSLVSGWTNGIGTINVKPSKAIDTPMINSNNGMYIGMMQINTNGEIGLYNSTGAAISGSLHITAVIAF